MNKLLAATVAGATIAVAPATTPAIAAEPNVVAAADYGVVCDGATDNSAALLAWITALIKGGAIGTLPAGTCAYSQAPIVFVNSSWKTILGQGSTATTLLYTGSQTNTDLVVVGAQPITQGPLVLSGFRISSNTTMVGGAALHVKNAAQVKIFDVDADVPIAGGTHKLFHGFWFDQISLVTLNSFNTWVQGDGIRVSGLGANAPGLQYDLFVGSGKISGGAIGVHVGGGFDNAHFDNMEITNNAQNVVVDNAVEPFKNQEVVFGPNVVTDQSLSGDNYYINDPLANSNNFCQIAIEGPITHANAGNGVHVHAWPHCGITITSPYIINNAQNGILVDDPTTFLTVSSASQILGNNYGIASSSPGFAGLLSTGTVVFNTTGAYENVVVPTR